MVLLLSFKKAYTDVIFITGSVGFSAHRFYIAAAAPSLARLIATATANSDINCSDIGTRSSSDCSMVCMDCTKCVSYLLAAVNFSPCHPE